MKKTATAKDTINKFMEDLSLKLNNINYNDKFSKEIIDDCIKHWVCIAKWYSDDIITLDWFISDEIYWEWYIGDDDVLRSECDCWEDCPYFKQYCSGAIHIEWSLTNMWNIIVDVKHYKFNIMREWELWCIGIISHV